MLEIKAVPMEFPAGANIIIGQSHFIKTVEDLYEAVCATVPQAKFGLAFNESSGDGNDGELRDTAIHNAQVLGCGPKGIEGQADIAWRHDLLHQIGYKR